MKKKLLFVNGHLNVGGIEKSLVDVLKNIDYSLYDVDLILFEGLGDFSIDIPKEVNIIFFDLTKTYGAFTKCIMSSIRNRDFFTLMFRIVLLLDRIFGVSVLVLAKPLFKGLKKYDCAIAYRMGICAEFVSYIVESNKKIAWWHHGIYDYSDKTTRRWKKTLLRIDNIVAVSNGCGSFLMKHIDNIEHKLVIVPNMVDYEEIVKKAEDNVKLNNNIKFISVGRLSQEKNMIACIEVCKKLVQDGYKLIWYIIGDGIEKANIEEKIKGYELEDNVCMLGSLTNPYPYIKKSNMFVHPSGVESQGIAILEALALGIPSVVAKSIGATEFIKNGENAVLVEPTIEELYKGVKMLLEDKNLYSILNEPKLTTLIPFAPKTVMDKLYSLIEGEGT